MSISKPTSRSSSVTGSRPDTRTDISVSALSELSSEVGTTGLEQGGSTARENSDVVFKETAGDGGDACNRHGNTELQGEDLAAAVNLIKNLSSPVGRLKEKGGVMREYMALEKLSRDTRAEVQKLGLLPPALARELEELVEYAEN